MQIRALLRKTFGNHLFFTNVGISFGLSGVGDLIEQKIERKQQIQQNSSNLVKKVSSINWSRTLHMSTAFGLTSGFLCHFWYNYLDRMLPGRGVRIIVQKIAWDQVFNPYIIIQLMFKNRSRNLLFPEGFLSTSCTCVEFLKIDPFSLSGWSKFVIPRLHLNRELGIRSCCV